jgi:hypothetical protein
MYFNRVRIGFEFGETVPNSGTYLTSSVELPCEHPGSSTSDIMEESEMMVKSLYW